VLAQAVLELRPGSTLGFGPAIDDGFYYDFNLSEPLSEEGFPQIERVIRRILKQGQRVEREQLERNAALARLDEMNEPYKREYAEALLADRGLERLSFYRNGPFLDMCEGTRRIVMYRRHGPGRRRVGTGRRTPSAPDRRATRPWRKC
jgi:threonyl-tRNA synthetase